jgi:aryl-alcohol dehydrogenase (NADP+)
LPESKRAGGVQKRYMNERGFAAVDKLEEVGRQTGLLSGHDATIAQTAIAWVLANQAVTSAIIGATSIAQLEDTAKGADVKLSAEVKEALDKVTDWKDEG